MRTLAAVLALGLLVAAAPAWPLAPAAPAASHGLSIHGDLKYGPGFAHFAYVNPQAPKGGSVTLAAIGTFDNLNPFILKGVPAAGIAMTFDTLTVASPWQPSPPTVSRAHTAGCSTSSWSGQVPQGACSRID